MYSEKRRRWFTYLLLTCTQASGLIWFSICQFCMRFFSNSNFFCENLQRVERLMKWTPNTWASIKIQQLFRFCHSYFISLREQSRQCGSRWGWGLMRWHWRRERALHSRAAQPTCCSQHSWEGPWTFKMTQTWNTVELYLCILHTTHYCMHYAYILYGSLKPHML